jgi:hypothetical protein
MFEYLKVGEMAMVQVLGSVEDKHIFSTFFSQKVSYKIGLLNIYPHLCACTLRLFTTYRIVHMIRCLIHDGQQRNAKLKLRGKHLMKL